MLSIERTYNVGQYQSLKVYFSLPVEANEVENMEKSVAYLTLLADLVYFNYISTSPVVNNSLSKTFMETLKETLKELQAEIKLDTTKEKGEG